MPSFLPFKALRPSSEYASDVSARSSDFKDQESLVNAMRNNPLSFHHVTKNHLNYSGEFQTAEKFLPFAAKFVQDLKSQGVLVKEQDNCYYIYHQLRKDGTSFKGIVGLTAVQDYHQDLIKKHEEIRPSRLGFLIDMCKTTKVLGEPTLLTFKAEQPLDLGMGEIIMDFVSVDGKRHMISKISDSSRVQEINDYMLKVPAFYLADGHHRSAAIAEFNAKHPEFNNTNCLALVMEESQLKISAFHRMIRNDQALSTDDLIEQLNRDFEITRLDHDLYEPQNKAEFGMFDGKSWYRLKLKYAEHLMDVELLEKYIVHSVYNIQDSRTDNRISFYAHNEGLDKLQQLITNKTFDVVFTLRPCDFSEIREISDNHDVLPPKSTFIEPKLRAGMIIQEF